MKTTTKLWTGIFILAVLSPLVLILPAYFKSGKAWGEWSREELNNLLGYIPRGLAKLSLIWNAPFPGYAFKGQPEKGLLGLSFGYIISTLIGLSITIIVAFLIGKKLTKKGD
jgi:cobalt/nickel transport protein